jgi:uncharacterized protein involved in response to NO
MTVKNTQISSRVWTRHIHEPFVRAALVIALTTGFGYGAAMVAMLALGVVPGAWYPALVQAHGHAQLFGWLGLFVMGMGLYFLPRLRGTQLQKQERLRYAFALLVTGIALRTLTQPTAGWLGMNALWRALLLLSSLLEIAGMVVVASALVATIRAQKPLTPNAPAYPVEPFAQIGFLCLALAYAFNFLGVGDAFLQARAVMAARYDQLVIQLILYGVAIPMVIVFSLRNLPLFMRLALPPRGGWRTLALVYAGALFLRTAPQWSAIADDALGAAGALLRANYVLVILFDALATMGTIALNGCILFFLWRLDLIRRRPPWIVDRAPNTRPDLDYLRPPSRANYPDNGEYGRFELLIYSAFVWLVVAVILDVLRALPGVDQVVTIPQDGARHALMAGFITLLIFGMAARMAPGFSGKRGVAYPDLVMWLFVLGNTAALLRVVPTFFPQSTFALMLWGLSGFVAWVAVLTLAILMWGTFRVERRDVPP